MTAAEAEHLVDEFIRDELKAIMGFAFGSFSGGMKLDDADAHFAAGCAHLATMRLRLIDIIVTNFPE
jgi:hypothetical protein